MSFLIVLIIMVIADRFVPYRYLIYNGFTDIKYRGILAREFMKYYGFLSFPRSVFIALMCACVILYENFSVNFIMYFAVAFFSLWFFFAMKDCGLAKKHVALYLKDND